MRSGRAGFFSFWTKPKSLGNTTVLRDIAGKFQGVSAFGAISNDFMRDLDMQN